LTLLLHLFKSHHAYQVALLLRTRQALAAMCTGCIGAIGADTLRQAVAAVADTLSEMGVRRVAPD